MDSTILALDEDFIDQRRKTNNAELRDTPYKRSVLRSKENSSCELVPKLDLQPPYTCTYMSKHSPNRGICMHVCIPARVHKHTQTHTHTNSKMEKEIPHN